MRGKVARVLIGAVALGLSACVTAAEAPAIARAVTMTCVAVDLSPGSATPTSGVVRAPLGPALVGGLRDGHRLEQAAAVRAPEAKLVSGGWLVAGRLADGAGTAVWLSQLADGAVFTSIGMEGSAERARWAAAAPEHTFLFSAEPVAATVSVWRDLGTPLPAGAIERARRCLE